MLTNLFAGTALKVATGIVAVLAIVVGVLIWQNGGLRTDKANLKRELVAAGAEIALLNTQAALVATAAEERQADTAAVALAEKELINAIAIIPDSVPDLVRVELGCRRLRRAGSADADIPPVCRPGGGAQAEAGP